MATYLKRTSKLFDISLSQSSVDISLRDLICPVCCSILIEPVTLPCTHNLCLRCLKGTFEHNSLSCPLCRVRVGSWLRTATKTETLVNNGLWELIRTKFPKEVEDKYNGDDKDIELDAGFTATDKILSVAGEIRREYEVQLQMAEEEIRCQRKAEQMASEALIRKIQEEEQQQQLAQLAQDQLLAKSLAKKQIADKHKDISKYYNDYPSTSNSSFQMSKFNVAAVTEMNPYRAKFHGSECEKETILEHQDSSGLRRQNIALISKIRAERYASSIKNNDTSGECNDTLAKFCCQKPIPIHNAISRTLKHQAVTKMIDPCTSNCTMEPGTSSSKIYGTQSKEELNVPNDVVNSKKKSLGVEVCMTLGDDDERMGSAESAGSHDSINQEIHHFKPIKAMPRTPLKTSTDGRQIDPKLIRVVPVLKRISNVVPKAPSQAHLKRIIGCSWSAFRGKTKQSFKEKDAYKEDTDGLEQKPSTSFDQSHLISTKITKSQIHDNIRKIDFTSELSFDSNKNYARNTNRIINGTKVSKKLTLDEHMDIDKIQKSWKPHARNGMVCKSKRQRNLWVKKDARNAKYTDETEARNSTSSSASVKISSPCDDEFAMQPEDDVTMENIAERIKRRKTNADKKSSSRVSSLNSEPEVTAKRNTRKRLCRKEDLEYKTDDVHVTVEKRSRTKFTRVALSKSKQRVVCRAKQSSTESSEKSDASVGSGCNAGSSESRKTARKSRRGNSSSANSDNYNSSESCSEAQECVSENNNTTELVMSTEKGALSDEEIVKEQERMERLVIQEKEDFELAQRLQAKFDEMERIAGRTRRSKKAIESETVKLDLYKINVGRGVQKSMDPRTAKPSILNHTVNTEAKKRRRPPKRVK
ncbi:E3 ubiquitin-protein ligase RNF169-like [Colletes gigas]|uniref:E3 ubiquitin-protein ligase RNF169-like n=1 Tax=Colletes gigas TaxID=935657 RepID=UPI001C9AFFBE|nr:E3 ubiquitin-protein ligase RNF169-like [Colletes gigas]